MSVLSLNVLLLPAQTAWIQIVFGQNNSQGKFNGTEFLKKNIFNRYFFAIQCRRPLKFPTVNSVRSNYLSLNIKGLHHQVVKI